MQYLLFDNTIFHDAILIISNLNIKVLRILTMNSDSPDKMPLVYEITFS